MKNHKDNLKILMHISNICYIKIIKNDKLNKTKVLKTLNPSIIHANTGNHKAIRENQEGSF